MLPDFFPLLRPGLHAFDAERAHELSLRALELGLYPRACCKDNETLRMNIFGLDFPNPVGMAAGFDKDARVLPALEGLGFGFAEAGTVTPLPQSGNPRPRLFRLPADKAVINRMGFNNAGLDAMLARLATKRTKIITGVNIGANRDTEDKAADYVLGLKGVLGKADYIAVNISSPNTPGLRNLQAGKELDALLTRLMQARGEDKTPLLIKIAPDLETDELEDIANAVMKHGVDGVIISNTTISREGLLSDEANETGGLSGAPLFAQSTDILARFYRLTEGKIPLIGVGGISSGQDAYDKILAGASLIQLYTGLVYQGPALIGRIRHDLSDLLAKDGYNALHEAVGAKADME